MAVEPVPHFIGKTALGIDGDPDQCALSNLEICSMLLNANY